MSEKQDNTVKINDKDYKLDDLTSKAKYFLGQVKDLEKKISQSKITLDQLEAAKKHFVFHLIDNVENGETK